MSESKIELSKQLCFPVYVTSRLIIREYQPHLEALGLTYPQYLVLMVLWQEDGLGVNEIAQKLFLNTNTITPLLKRMEKQALLVRKRSSVDERKVQIVLTPTGKEMEQKALHIPEKLIGKLRDSDVNMNELRQLKQQLEGLIDLLAKG